MKGVNDVMNATTQNHSIARRLLAATLATASVFTATACAQDRSVAADRPTPAARPADVEVTATRPATTGPATSRPSTKPATTTAAKRPNFIDTIEAYERRDAAAMPAPGGIVFYGSSTIIAWDLKKSFPELPVLNRGFGGSQMHQALMYDDRICFKYQPKVVVLYEGDNDLAAGKTSERIMEEIKTFAGRMHEKLPDSKLVLMAVKPSPMRWKNQPKIEEFNALQRMYAAENAAWVKYVDVPPEMYGEDGAPRPELYRDRLHMTEAGYALWNDAMRPVLTKLLNDGPSTNGGPSTNPSTTN